MTPLIEQIKKHEGFSALPYLCPAGKVTIGYGWNLEHGIEEPMAERILTAQVSKIQWELIQEFEWYRSLSNVRRDVITNMVFNLGMTGFKGFKRMIKAIEEGNNEAVVDEMLDSKWAHQVGSRAWELADQWRDEKILDIK